MVDFIEIKECKWGYKFVILADNLFKNEYR